MINAEAQLAACFFLFCSTMYTQLGPQVGKYLDEYSDNVAKDMLKVDDAMQSQLKSVITANEMALTLVEDYKSLYALEDSLAAAQAETLNHMVEHKYRDDLVKKLDSLHALEESATAAIRSRMINTVKAEVVASFQNDKKAQEAALNQAIAVLAAGPGSKRGKDVVGAAFGKAVKSYREAYAKLPEGSDDILVQLQKDMAAVAVAPVPQYKGGNVFA